MSASLDITGRPMRKNGGAVEIRVVKLNQIKLSRNSRMTIRDEELTGLMSSIKEEGLLEPIGLVKVDAGYYEICYGNRRFLACSKLGYKEIPAVVHEIKDARDIDMKNLAENIQRRSINLHEAGRYMAMLSENGLTQAEISIRLGVSTSYVNSCLMSYNGVPREFRKDLEVRVSYSGKTAPEKGKISIRAARDIVSAQKSGFLTAQQSKELLKAARDNPKFATSHLPAYIAGINKGKKDVVSTIEAGGYKQVYVRFLIKETDYNKLKDKHFGEEGAFKNMADLCLAILRGEKSVQIPLIKNRK